MARFVSMIIALSVAVLFSTLMGCARSDSGGAGPVSQPIIPIIGHSMDLASKDSQFARYFILQVSRTRQIMDLVLRFELNQRINGKPGGESDEIGCYRLKKIGPHPDRAFATSTEKFQILYRECDDTFASQKSAEANFSGTEDYVVSYGKIFPKTGDVDQTLGLPSSVTFDRAQLSFSMRMKADPENVVKVDREVAFSSQLVDENEKTGTYAFRLVIKDEFRSNMRTEYRAGKVITTVDQGVIVVDKEYRKVTALRLKPGAQTIAIIGEKFEKSEGRYETATLRNRQELDSRFEIDPRGALSLPESSCGGVIGDFKVRRIVAKDTRTTGVSSNGTMISTEGNDAGNRPLSLCEKDGAKPAFLEVLEDVYL